ncbi:related to peptide-n4-(n-acetyl-beta-d-glucosaminyl) asparaginase amidase N [Cephalotrichum gorgonifer]|uniref:Related to peptide-n4-(N-acetyl-beta-d-glucosaminyl) asparaginase amidase N n=1 Tax=Cephalotrichum gorgonifer TaxID=2041049 RepID=A0AAE8N5L6_9PEZI|nr:related to peptide-n4-(n-acetyl-beta-d-glucosaminyl) asparaginase amidase N [Cephalotrichum gorgonifer]
MVMVSFLRVLAALASVGAALSPGRTPSRRQASGGEGEKLECFQLAQPVLGPDGPVPSWGRGGGDDGGERCEVLLMEHSFGWSYDLPFLGNYTPPDCAFNRVILDLTVVSAGHQFDRLALMYLGDTEVWRTSTAEPTEGGIAWTHRKDVTPFLSLWRTPQKLIFDLGNLIDETYTAPFNTTLTATFFSTAPGEDEGGEGGGEAGIEEAPADVIIPLSARRGGEGKASAWHVPETPAVATVTGFPRNARRAVVSVSANGQMDEEFWWYNVPPSDALAFEPTAGELAGKGGPFREVQVLLDGEVVGVQWPFPVVFTGGVSPTFHRPVVGPQAFDLREGEVDVTAWLPVLCDGGAHTLEIRVVGVDGAGEEVVVTEGVGGYWVVTGKIFVWVDEDEGAVTTGGTPSVTGNGNGDLAAAYTAWQLTRSADGVNESLHFALEARREISVSNTIVSQAGERRVSWTQSLGYVNNAVAESFGLDQLADLVITSRDVASDSYASDGAGDDGVSYVAESYYPLRAWSAVRIDGDTGGFTINATMRQGARITVGGAAVFPSGLEAFGGAAGAGAGMGGSRLATVKESVGYISRDGEGGGYGTGRTDQRFSFAGIPEGGGEAVPLYTREVRAENDVVLGDKETMGPDTIKVYSVSQAVGKGRATEWADEASLGRGVGRKVAGLLGEKGGERLELLSRVIGGMET